VSGPVGARAQDRCEHHGIVWIFSSTVRKIRSPAFTNPSISPLYASLTSVILCLDEHSSSQTKPRNNAFPKSD
jgi:hypothetical protein